MGCCLPAHCLYLAALQGFSVAWWKDKHNLHHAAPNEARLDGSLWLLQVLSALAG